jgi:Spy/CpxP family protein refolding chaperone
MMRRSALVLVGCFALAGYARAQDVSVPAGALLAMRERLSLDSAQLARLRELEKAQSPALARTMAAFLRAEADVIESSRGEDLVKRRFALEARSRVAIDAEIARIKGEKESRAVLTPKQLADIPDGGTSSRRAMVWRDLVSPVSVAPPVIAVADSAEVRISVTPSYADIYLNGEKRGTGRKVLLLPIGIYELKFFAVGCTEVLQRIEIRKGPPLVLNQPLTCSK